MNARRVSACPLVAQAGTSVGFTLKLLDGGAGYGPTCVAVVLFLLE